MKIYIYGSYGFTDEDKLAQHLFEQKIKGLSTYQDCLDWAVYADYINVDLTNQIISYGIVYTDNYKVYFCDFDEFEDYVKLNQVNTSVWYPNIIIK